MVRVSAATATCRRLQVRAVYIRGGAGEARPMLGEVIHGYRVDRALSADKGGFGDVFFATHVESGAEAVVKVL
jgi:hypothetical protein